jgi:membrane protein implicated in regulation of membrane protease activity
MHLGSPDTWRVLWVVAAGVFIVAELLHRLRLWMLPLAVGAGAAAGMAFAGVAVSLEWVVFVAVSIVTLVALRPMAKRFALSGPPTDVGAARWTGRQARVEVAIPPTGDGWVRLGRERWRAESGLGLAIPVGSTVLVTGVNGTCLTVLPIDVPENALPEQGV